MKKIALVGGGSGGHITPLLAIYNFSKSDKNLDFIWIGENNSLEEKIARENGITFFGVKSGKFRRYFSLQTILEPFKITYGVFQSIGILKKENVSIIFSKGGHVSLPVAVAGKILGIKIYLHESDIVSGLANRLVGKFAYKIFLGFDSAKRYFKQDNCEVVGQILNPELFKNLGEIKNSARTNLLVLAGSQGSTRIFNFLADNLDKLKEFDIKIVLGSLNSHLKNKFVGSHNVETFGFVDHSIIKKLYNEADVAISRGSVTILAELESFNIKTIIIPLQESANNHQYFNAIEYSKKGSIVLLEKDLYSKGVSEILQFKKYKKDKKEYKYDSRAVDTISLELSA